MDKQPSKRVGKEEGLKVFKQCPLCQKTYVGKGVSLIEENDDTMMLHLECLACHHSLLAMVSASPIGLSAVGSISDLTAEDARVMRGSQPINSDELLSLHTYLQTCGTILKNNFFIKK